MTGTCLEARCIGTQQKIDTRDQSWTVWGVQVRQFSAFLSSGSGLCLRTLGALSGKTDRRDVNESIAARCWGGSNGTCFLRTPWILHIILLGILMIGLQKTTWSFVGATLDQGKYASHATTLQSASHQRSKIKTLQTNHHSCLGSPCCQQSSAALSDFLHTLRLPI